MRQKLKYKAYNLDKSKSVILILTSSQKITFSGFKS